jgi:hypothetical protein
MQEEDLNKSTMSKRWKGESRRYHPEWEEEFSWVKKASDGSENAFCKDCSDTLLPKHYNLKKHETSAKHEGNCRRGIGQATINFQVVGKTCGTDNTKRCELELAVLTACHCSIATVDHFTNFITKNVKQGDNLANVHLHRTKCSNLIKNVISEALKNELVRDMKGKKYCILVDESTDVSAKKILSVLVRYYSAKEKAILTSLAGLTEIVQATGENVFEALKKILGEIGLQLDSCIGLSCDGASSMIGKLA